ncbi:hypothetical protein FGO68_gene3706 [Halteria grandinella]|uniref:TLDc domain-containing protein n=1 Tax=Halteria grandinella TaxID=5974 RepID=A0A8J8NTR4_HALGN|nr:hypothetical protein FGO68_gene3706 [Halteria grandinella]
MDLCSCGSKNKVMFQCEEQTCPSFGRQKLYCPLCMIPQKHPHIPIMIALKSQNVTDEWNSLRQDIKNLHRRLTEWMELHGAIVELLDGFLTNEEHTLSFQIERVKILNTNVESFYEQHVSESSARGEILKLQELNPSLNAFNERLNSLKYLNKIGPAVLWTTYSEVLHLISHQQVLERLSQANFQIFLKLKLHRVQLSLNDVLNNRVIPSGLLQILENPELSISQIISSLHEKLQYATNNQQATVIDSIKVAGIRSDLDAIGVSLMFTGLLEKFKNLESQIINNQNIKITELAQKNEQLEERLSTLIHSQLEEFKVEFQAQKLQIQSFQESFDKRNKIQCSKILADEAMQNKIKTFFEQSGMALKYSCLLFRGSIDSFTSKIFHQLCDNRTNTLTIVKSTDGKIVGGFTTQTWNHSGYKQDGSAWLFNMQANNIFKVKPSANAIFAYSSYGPTFGNGHDLIIHDNCNSNSSSYANASSYDYNGSGNLFLTQAQAKFQVQEIEVYQL